MNIINFKIHEKKINYYEILVYIELFICQGNENIIWYMHTYILIIIKFPLFLQDIKFLYYKS